MGALREIVDLAALSRVFNILALIGPAFGLIIGLAMGVLRRSIARFAIGGLAFGLLFTANAVLWRLYNAITDANGLDSVRNVFINLSIFVGIGIAAGLVIGAFQRRGRATAAEERS